MNSCIAVLARGLGDTPLYRYSLRSLHTIRYCLSNLPETLPYRDSCRQLHPRTCVWVLVWRNDFFQQQRRKGAQIF